MNDESYELAVALKTENAEQTREEIEQTGDALDETVETLDESSDQAQELSKSFTGALSAITAGLAVVTGTLISKVPVLGESMSGLGAVAAAIGFQIDRTLRPALSKVNEELFSLSDAIFGAEGPAGTLIGVLGTLAIVGSAVAGALIAIGGLLPGLTISGVLGSALSALTSFVGTLAGLVTGSLAAAVAFGVFLGLLGVAALEATGVLDAVRNLGSAVGEALPAAARDGALAFISALLGPLAVIGAATSGFVSGVLDGGLSEGIDRAISNAKEVIGTFVGAWRRTLGRIGDVVGGFVEDAFQWGRALIEEFASGIESKISDVAGAASDVAAEARAHLPGSPADRGPLSDLDEAGPALAETFADGMAGGVGRVRSAAVNVAGAADNGSDGGDTVRVSTSSPDILLDGRKIERQTGRVGRDDTARRGI
jgi:methyl-accepting chemotaxis protein